MIFVSLTLTEHTKEMKRTGPSVEDKDSEGEWKTREVTESEQVHLTSINVGLGKQSGKDGSRGDLARKNENEVTVVNGEGNMTEVSGSSNSELSNVLAKGEIFKQPLVINLKRAGIVAIGEGNLINLSTDEDNNKTRNELILELDTDGNLRAVIRSNPKMFPNALERKGPCAGTTFSRVTETTRYLTDAGLTDKFYRFTDTLLTRMQMKENHDMHVHILLQRVVFRIYANKLQDAEQELNRALLLIGKCINQNLFLGRCYTYQAYIALYQHDYPKALEMLGKAKHLLAYFVSGEEKAMVCYLLGYLYMKLAGQNDAPSRDLETKALEYFQLHFTHAKEDSEKAVADKELQYGILKQVTVYLRTYTREGYDFKVDKESLKKAKQLLDYFEVSLWHEASPASKIHFIALRSDYFYRQNCLQRAMDILEMSGLKLAKSVGHKPMIDMVSNRIALLKSLLDVKEGFRHFRIKS